MSVRLPLTHSGVLTGATDEVDYGDLNFLDGASQATLYGWLYYDPVDQGRFLQRVNAQQGIALGIYSAGSLEVIVPNGSISTSVRTTANVLTAAGWHNYIATYDAGTISIWINGTPESTTAFGAVPSVIGTPTAGTPWTLGLGGAGSAPDITLSSIAVWGGVAANATQVAELYDGGRAHDLAFTSLGAPDFWAPLSNSWTTVSGVSGTLTGTPSFTASTPPLVPAAAAAVHTSTRPDAGHGADPAGAMAHGSEEPPAANTGTPTVASWCTTAKGWLLSQFHDKPKFTAFLCAMMAPIQEFEDAIAYYRDTNNLDDATGVTLNNWGDFLGLPRQSLPDPEISDSAYRAALKGQAAARSSRSSPDDMIKVALKLLAGGVTLTERFPAGVTMTAASALDYAEGQLFARIIRSAKPAAVDYFLSYKPRIGVLAYDDDPVITPLPVPEDGASSPVLAEDEPGLGGA